jgi:hypothetical protein
VKTKYFQQFLVYLVVKCVIHDRFVLHGLILICYVTPLSVYIGPYPHTCALDFVHLLKRGMQILIITQQFLDFGKQKNNDLR